MSRARDLRTKPIDGNWADELAMLRHRGLRLGHRLERLEHEGLLNLAACRPFAPDRLLAQVLTEIADECERRGITTRLCTEALEVHPGLDPDQLREAVRCALDEALVRVGSGGTVELMAAQQGDAIEVTVRHDGRGPGGDPLALDLLEHLAESLDAELSTHRAARWTRIVLSLPVDSFEDLEDEPTREWVFPTPTAA